MYFLQLKINWVDEFNDAVNIIDINLTKLSRIKTESWHKIRIDKTWFLVTRKFANCICGRPSASNVNIVVQLMIIDEN